MVTDGGNGIGHDQVGFVNLYIEPAIKSASSSTIEKRNSDIAEWKNELEQCQSRLKSLVPPSQVYGVVAQEPPKTFLLTLGNTEAPRDEVTPGTIGCLSRLQSFALTTDASDSERRIALANWIASGDNPLTDRVIVNRIWQQHFGVGIVDTPSDFGLGGSLPTHPELLDWLAIQLRENRYSLKAIHRLICCSAAYRQSSVYETENENHRKAIKIDSSNRLLWKQVPRRLDAESIRDAILATSGQLKKEMGGPGFRDFDYKEEYAPVYSYISRDDDKLNRRSIYRFRVRTTPHALLTTFDCPNPANLTPTRSITTTALQSLALMNHDFVIQQSDSFAMRLQQATNSLEEQVDLGWRLAIGRRPNDEEQQASLDLVRAQGLNTFCRFLLNTNEFVYVD